MTLLQHGVMYYSLSEMEAMEEMKNLRGKLPSGSALKALQSYDVLGEEIGNYSEACSCDHLHSFQGPLILSHVWPHLGQKKSCL